MIINLHGFNSAGDNNTYSELRKFFEPTVRVISPTYTVYNFSRGLDELDAVVREESRKGGQNLLFVGSSTGAVFAEMLAKKFKGKVVVINPITDPHLLEGALGQNRNYRTDEEYVFAREDLDTFSEVEHNLAIPRLVLVDNGDPVIDHTKTCAFYAGHGRYMAFDGDSHRFSYFKEALPAIEKLYQL